MQRQRNRLAEHLENDAKIEEEKMRKMKKKTTDAWDFFGGIVRALTHTHNFSQFFFFKRTKPAMAGTAMTDWPFVTIYLPFI